MATITFTRQAMTVGGSTGVTLPPEILQYLDVKVGDNLTIQPENGKKGKYISIWKQE